MITVLFSCHQCGLSDCEASVRARKPDEDVVEWMKQTVGSALEFAHLVESPLCRNRVLKDVKIPIPSDKDNGYIGQQTDIVPPKGIPKR